MTTTGAAGNQAFKIQSRMSASGLFWFYVGIYFLFIPSALLLSLPNASSRSLPRTAWMRSEVHYTHQGIEYHDLA